MCISLCIALAYNHHFHSTLVWNIDMGLLGTFFVLFGYLFSHYEGIHKKVLLSNRWISLTIGIVLFSFGLLISFSQAKELNLFPSMYLASLGKYYLTIPSMILGTLGILYIARGIDNIILSSIGKTTIVILTIQQELIQRLFRIIFKDWYNWINKFDENSLNRLLYGFVASITAVIIGYALYKLIEYSPFAFAIGKKNKPFYQKAFAKSDD